jgi:hypothetical protein
MPVIHHRCPPSHLVLACVSTVMIWLVWWVHFRARRRTEALPNYRLVGEFLAACIRCADWALGRLPERRKRAWLDKSS